MYTGHDDRQTDRHTVRYLESRIIMSPMDNFGRRMFVRFGVRINCKATAGGICVP